MASAIEILKKMREAAQGGQAPNQAPNIREDYRDEIGAVAARFGPHVAAELVLEAEQDPNSNGAQLLQAMRAARQGGNMSG